jgi:hypothetical protein
MPPKQNQTAKPHLNEDGKVYGEFDTAQKYPFPAGWWNSVVVTQYNVETMGSGHKQIDEGSRRTMPYGVDVFNKLVKDQGFEDLQYFILHDPR